MLTPLAAALSLPIASATDPARAPLPVPSAQAAAHPFAELLRQNQASAAAPQSQPATPPAPAPATQAGPAPTEAPHPAEAAPPAHEESASSDTTDTAAADTTEAPEANQAPTSATKGKARSTATEKTERSKKPVGVDSTSTDATSDARADAKKPSSTTTDASVAPWFALLHAPQSTPPSSTPGSGAELQTASADAKAHRVELGKDTAVTTRNPLVADAAGPNDRSATATATATNAGDAAALATATSQATFAAAAATSSQELRNTQAWTPGSDTGIQALTPSALSLSAAPTPLGAASTPVEVHVATPLDAPDFAQTLGAQVSVLAKDGVQRAELHLNPAEMGPVSVHIVMDGTQARVEFGANAAATRQAIEAGIPELASAMRDAGLTLSGGGVSEHASNRQSQPGDERQAGSRSTSVDSSPGAEARATARPRWVAAGGVDLYA